MPVAIISRAASNSVIRRSPTYPEPKSSMDSSQPQGTARRAPPRFFFELEPPSPEANIQSPFFQIALELRDTIYHHLWDGEKITRCEEGDTSFSLDYGNSDKRRDSERRLLPWSLACKQMLAEAMSQFYRHARCTHYHYGFPGNIPESPFRLLSLYRVGTVLHQYEECPCPLEVAVPSDNEGKFYAIREHWDSFSFDYEEEEITWPVSDYASLDKYQLQDFMEWALIFPSYHHEVHYEPSDPVLAYLVKHLEICNHMVKDLTLEFYPPTYQDRDTHPEIMQDGKERTVHVDMSYLERLGANFDRVEFILSAWRVVRDSWDHRMFVKIQQEFARVAKVLIGADDGATWALKDWFATGRTSDDTGGWHVEVRRVTNGPSRGEITYEGLFPGVESHPN